MAQPFTTGPGHTYISAVGPIAPIRTPPTPVTPSYLGVFETTPKIQIRPHFSRVMSDVAGDSVPHDWIFSGRDGMLIGDLTVHNWPVLLRAMSRPNMNAAGSPPASFLTDLAGSIGSLMVTEGFAYQVWVQFPYASKAAYAGLGMIAGLRFPTAWLFGPDEFDMGTKVNKVHVQFYMGRSLNPITGDWVLGDTDMTGIPTVPPTTASGI